MNLQRHISKAAALLAMTGLGFGLAAPCAADVVERTITLKQVARTASQGFGSDTAAAESVAFDPANQRIFTVNADSGRVDVFAAADLTALDNADPAAGIDLKAMLVAAGKVHNGDLIGNVNSVSIHGKLAAVAVEAAPKTDPGWVVFIDVSTLAYVNAVRVGALPDMLTFTPNGRMVVVAIEGEPDDYTIDPEGSVDIIRVADFSLHRAGFRDFNVGGPRERELPAEVRIYGLLVDIAGQPVRPSTVAEDLEPEFVAISKDSRTAYVTLQENNAIAVVDLHTATISRIIPLGFKDHRLPGNELDASDRDGAVNIRNWPVYGMYLPDAVAAYRVNGIDFLVTANEGDSRADWGIEQVPGDETTNLNMEEYRVRTLKLDPDAFPNASSLQANSQLGRLKVTSKLGDTDGDGDFDALYAYGARSFAIWNAATGELVFDSGSALEQLTASRYGIDFNNNHEENAADGRSDDKGPEPEGVVLGIIDGRTYAFIGLERMGGIVVYDVSDPYAPEFLQYLNNRDLTLDPEIDGAAAGELGPEGLLFVKAADSPSGKPMLIVGKEVSGTTAVYEIDTQIVVTLPHD